MNKPMKAIEQMATVLANPFLFDLFYLMDGYRKPVSLQKLSADLQVEEDLVRDHLTVLVRLGVVTAENHKYLTSQLGQIGLRFLHEGLGEIGPKPSVSAEVVFDDYAPVPMNPTTVIVENVPSSSTISTNTDREAARFRDKEHVVITRERFHASAA